MALARRVGVDGCCLGEVKDDLGTEAQGLSPTPLLLITPQNPQSQERPWKTCPQREALRLVKALTYTFPRKARVPQEESCASRQLGCPAVPLFPFLGALGSPYKPLFKQKRAPLFNPRLLGNTRQREPEVGDLHPDVGEAGAGRLLVEGSWGLEV